MRLDSIALRRLAAQRLIGRKFKTVDDAVRSLVAVQAQDYVGAKWALGLRVSNIVESDVDHAMATGRIIRTHVLRPTWHFVAAEDLRWLLTLTAPRVQLKAATYYRKTSLTPQVLQKLTTRLARELAKKRACTRDELAKMVGISGPKLGLALIYAELEQVICSGPRVGKHLTWTGVDDWVAPTKPRSRDAALAELTRRYLDGHGPAKDVDLANWSGLALGDARRGLELANWKEPAPKATKEDSPVVHLLPNFDEFLIGYKDRSASYDPTRFKKQPSLLSHFVVVDGQLVGGWRRKGTDQKLIVQLSLGRKFSTAERVGLEASGAELQRFTGVPVHFTGW